MDERERNDKPLSAAARAAQERARRRRAQARRRGPAEDFRPEGEDDDGYDPYSDYMDRLARSGYEPPSEDPWR